jgi:copper(I)-binding protein
VLSRTATLLAAGCAVLGLAACGAGFEPLTYQERNQGGSTDLSVGELEVRAVTVRSPEEGYVHEAGDSVAVSFAVVNPSTERDSLVEVTTDAAGSVELQEDGDAVDEIEVPAQGTTGEDVEIELVELTRDVRSGEYVELTLMFERNGSETFLVPVSSPTDPGEREHSDNLHEEEE